MSNASRVLNRILLGKRDEDFSARVGRRALTSKRWHVLEVLIDFVFGKDHCWLSYLDEVKKGDAP